MIFLAGLATCAVAGPSSIHTGNSERGSRLELAADPAGDPNGWTVDVSGLRSVDAAGSSLNDQINFVFGGSRYVYAIEYVLTIRTFGSSWLSDVKLSFYDTPEQFIFTPGASDDTPGTATYSSGGQLDLADFGMQPFLSNDYGTLPIEIFESFVDNPGFVEAEFLEGSKITIYALAFPTPGTLGLLGLGALVVSRRRRPSSGPATPR